VGRFTPSGSDFSASIEQAVQRGRELWDSFRGEPASWRELQRESRLSAAAARREQRAYTARKSQAQTLMIGGTAVGASSGTVGVIDLVATSSGEFAWFAIAAAGAVAGVIGARAWRRLVPPAPVTPIEAAPAAVRRGAIGHESVLRYTAVRVQVVQVARAIEPLHADAAAEIRSADAQVAPTLNALAERLRVLDDMSRRMPGTTTAQTAVTSAHAVSEQLDRGSAAYDVLLAAAARLLAEPDIGQPAPAILEPASTALIAYAHGLRSASQI